MSTASKLNPNVRTARKRRKQAVDEMHSFAHNFAGGNVRIESVAYALDQVRHDPRFTGAQKDAKFRALLNRAR